MKKIFYIIVVFISCCTAQKVGAQCSISVPNYVSGGNQAVPFNKSYVQTFKPTCTGVLRNLVFANIYNAADDFRSSGYFIECRIRDASGNILAIAPRTDQWYPGATVTYEFSCRNVGLTAGTTYQFELLEIDPGGTSTFPVYLLRRSNSASVYADGNCILDGTSYPNGDLYGWSVNLFNGAIATSNSSVRQVLTPCGGFYNSSNELVTSILPGSINGITGTTTAKTWIESIQPAQFVRQHYEITPAANAANATGRVTLYFTQAEFTAYNNQAPSLMLPTGPADATGKANLRIEKRAGVSNDGTGLPGSYPGVPQTIDPLDADIVYNTAASRWDVSFDVTGFSGFFVKTQLGVLPIHRFDITASINSESKPEISWKVSETDVLRYEIEKSTDRLHYFKIGERLSLGNGTNTYSFTEETKLYNKAFYRVMQIRSFTQTIYSPITELSGKERIQIEISPNPAEDYIKVTVPLSLINTTANVLDLTGKQLFKINLVEPTVVIKIDHLQAGGYVLRFDDGSSRQFIKH